jgi:hypothetical protein
VSLGGATVGPGQGAAGALGAVLMHHTCHRHISRLDAFMPAVEIEPDSRLPSIACDALIGSGACLFVSFKRQGLKAS